MINSSASKTACELVDKRSGSCAGVGGSGVRGSVGVRCAMDLLLREVRATSE